MGLDSEDLPPPYKDVYKDVAEGSSERLLQPATFAFKGESIVCETTAGTVPVYELSWDVTAIPPKSTSAIFERVDVRAPEKADSTAPTQRQSEHLFYLARPARAQYQTDIPAYYITCATAEHGAILGNISLETSSKKMPFPRTEFSALLHAGKSSEHSPLFADKTEALFDARMKLIGGRYVWADSRGGGEVAQEEEKDGQRRLIITAPMNRGMRDALVATWCLRLWHDTAESRVAKRDGRSARGFLKQILSPINVTSASTPLTVLLAMDRLTPPEAARGLSNSKTYKRINTLVSLGGGGA